MDNLEYPPVLIRGVPGSGKSTLARTLYPDRLLIEADQYFMVGDRYCFDHSCIADAHKWCFWRCKQAFNAGIPCVVANTFSRYWEIKEYLRKWPNAKVIRCEGRFPNVHGVPESAVKKMRDRFEPIHGEEIVHQKENA